MNTLISPAAIPRPDSLMLTPTEHEHYWTQAAAGEMAATLLFDQAALASNPFIEYALAQEAAKSLVEAGKSRYENLCNTDSLTGLHNRRSITQIYEARQLKPITSDRRRDDVEPKDRYFMFIDADDFKKINTDRKYEGGDLVLVKLAKILIANMREQRGDTAGRLGGDEFVLILEGLTRERVEDMAMAIRQDIKYISKTTVSIGMCVIDPNKSLKETVADAEEALTKAKEQGKNKSVLFGSLQS